MDNNETLAACYYGHIPQTVMIWPNIWRHDPGQDWVATHTFSDDDSSVWRPLLEEPAFAREQKYQEIKAGGLARL